MKDHEGTGLFVDGASTRSEDAAQIDVTDPSTGRPRLAIPAGCVADVARAVASARRAFEDGRWSHSPPSVKKQTLLRFADLIEQHASELDVLDAGDMGKPVSELFGNAASAAVLLRFYAEAVDKLTGDVYASDQKSLVLQRNVPRGVIGAIVPWNFPTFVALVKLAPALAAGNCVVLKPSELSPRSALELAHLAIRAGLPPGVFNVVLGLGETVGRALALHPDVDMITFTGSTATGKRMLEYAAQSNMKVVMTECGGKSPQIVFDDGVDLDAASEAIARFILINQGQICSVGSRVLVQKSIEPIVTQKIAARFAHIVMGSALDRTTTFGPVASASQHARVMHYIETAAGDGANLVVGGRRALPDSGGYFVEPTLLRTPASARIAREEVFGPVLAIIAFDDEADAIRIANDTMYGLLATVWTSQLSTGLRMANGIRSSAIINAAAPSGEGPGHAFSSEPARQSGIGIEGGLAGMESYMRRQLVWFNHG